MDGNKTGDGRNGSHIQYQWDIQGELWEQVMKQTVNESRSLLVKRA